MKILFVTGGVPSPIGQNHVLHLLRTLSRAHQITVISFDLNEPYLADSREELDRLAQMVRVPLPKRSLIMRGIRSLFSLVPVAVQGFRSEAMRHAIAQACRATTWPFLSNS